MSTKKVRLRTGAAISSMTLGLGLVVAPALAPNHSAFVDTANAAVSGNVKHCYEGDRLKSPEKLQPLIDKETAEWPNEIKGSEHYHWRLCQGLGETTTPEVPPTSSPETTPPTTEPTTPETTPPTTPETTPPTTETSTSESTPPTTETSTSESTPPTTTTTTSQPPSGSSGSSALLIPLIVGSALLGSSSSSGSSQPGMTPTAPQTPAAPATSATAPTAKPAPAANQAPAAAASKKLANTGVDSWMIILLGVLLAAAGGASIIGARKVK